MASQSTTTIIETGAKSSAALGVPGFDSGQPEAVARIDTVESLREHLQWAIELEHFTIPPYLCALYSLDPDRNPDALAAVSGVVVEEMLHMALAANLLNAIGGQPQIDTPRMLPAYPCCLPHGDQSFEVPLMRFCPEALEIFLKIEQPAAPGDPQEPDGYRTIAQFYAAIEQGLRGLCDRLGEAAVFSGDISRQITNEFYTGGGRIVVVHDLDSALEALAEIVEQGEGADHVEVWDRDCDPSDPERREVAHYYRFQELRHGRRYRAGDTPGSGPTGEAISVDWDGVRLMRRNPRMREHLPGSPIRKAQEDFNTAYCEILRLLDEAFDGRPHVLQFAIGAMYSLAELAQALMHMPTWDGGQMAGPSFEYISPERRSRTRRPNPVES